MHVRFFTPWSTLAAHVGQDEPQKRMVIEMAQQAYLPKRVNYYVNGSERNLDSLAQSFGVSRRELCRWNQISGGTVLTPGSCLVFYKRGFEAEPVRLAQSLQPGFISEAPPMQYASLRSSTESVSDAAQQVREIKIKEKKEVEEKKVEAAPAPPPIRALYMVRRGDTVDNISRRTGIDLKTLCQLNGIKKTTPVKPGQTLRLASVQMLPTAIDMPASAPSKAESSKKAPVAAKPAPVPATYSVAKGDTLDKISKKTGVDVETLMKLNGLKKNTTLHLEQEIKLPKPATKAPVSTASAKAAPQQALKAQPASKGAPQPAAKNQPAKNQPASAKKATASKSAPVAAAKTPGKTPATGAKAVSAPQKAPAGGKAAVQSSGGNKNAKSGTPVGKLSDNGKQTAAKKRVN